MKKIFCSVFCGILALASGCKVSTKEETNFDVFERQNNLYGVCYLAWEEVMRNGEGLNEEKISRLIENLGAKSVRVWLRANDFLASPTEIIPKNVERMRNILKTLKENALIMS